MARLEESLAMTPKDDELASLLIEVGYSYRQAAEFMGRSDKTIKAACERVKSGTSKSYTNAQRAKAKRLLELRDWIDHGRKNGYLEALVAFLEAEYNYE